MRQGKYHEIDFKCHSFKSFVHLIEINQLFHELKSETRLNVPGNLRLGEADDANYGTGLGTSGKAQNDQFNSGVQEIGDDFIN